MSQLERKTSGKTPSTGFRLAKSDAKLWGVCGGIANYLNIDATMVRIAFVVATLVGVGLMIPIYAAVALIAD